MNKIGLIIKREYLRRVSKKSFILLTFLTPLLLVALVFVPLWLSSIKGSDVKIIAVNDTTGKYAALLKDADNYQFKVSERSLEEHRQQENGEFFAFLNITDDLLKNPKAAVIYSEKQVPMELSDIINRSLRTELEREKVESFNIPDLQQIIDETKVNFSVQTIKWSKDGKETVSSAEIAFYIGFLVTMLIFMFIMTYGGMVMTGVMEEKKNRIVEIMVSSVKPFDLMMGKIVGIGMVGITQLILWGVLTILLIGVGQVFFGGSLNAALAESANMQQGMANVDMESLGKTGEIVLALQSFNFVEIGICFVLFFIGGYLLYASLFSAIGASVDNEEDTQQFMVPVTILLAFALYAGIYSLRNPDGPLAFWCSIFPLTSPIVMMMRLPSEVPMWELLLSIALLYGTSILCVWISARIYRVGILMYGKKPSLKEMIKWMKYK